MRFQYFYFFKYLCYDCVMKKSLFLLLISPLILGSCTETNPGKNQEQKQSEETEEETFNVSEFPKEYQDYIIYSVNGNVPFLEAFNTYNVGSMDASCKPYFNPSIKGAKKDFSNDYKILLEKMGFTYDSTDDYSGYSKKYYVKNDFYVTTAYYKGSDNLMWFDVYAWYDKDASYYEGDGTALTTSSIGLSGSGYKDCHTTINGYDVTGSNLCKNNGIQFNKSTGKLKIKGSADKVFINFSQYPHNLIFYQGTSENDKKPVFYNAGEIKSDKAKYSYYELSSWQNQISKIDSIYLI